MEYSSIPAHITVSESRLFTVRDAIETMKTLDFGEDQNNLMPYLDKRWLSHPIYLKFCKLRTMGDKDKLQKFLDFPATRVEVEKVFSSPNHVMSDRHQIGNENLINYIRTSHESSKRNSPERH